MWPERWVGDVQGPRELRWEPPHCLSAVALPVGAEVPPSVKGGG